MAITYEPIATYTAGAGGVTSFEFTSIPQTYTDLRVIHSMRLKSGNANVYNKFTYNNVTTGNIYGYLRWYIQSSTALQQGSANDYQPAPSTLTSTTIPVVSTIDIFGYSDATIKKTSIYTVSQNFGATGAYVIHPCSFVDNTAITSIKIEDAFGGGFAEYSTATLYGIKAA
jgi:hypothetical protein